MGTFIFSWILAGVVGLVLVHKGFDKNLTEKNLKHPAVKMIKEKSFVSNAVSVLIMGYFLLLVGFIMYVAKDAANKAIEQTKVRK